MSVQQTLSRIANGSQTVFGVPVSTVNSVKVNGVDATYTTTECSVTITSGTPANGDVITIVFTLPAPVAPGGGALGDSLVANPLSQFAATTSLQLKGVLSDETGTGAAVFANTPTLITPVLGAATATTIVSSGNVTAPNIPSNVINLCYTLGDGSVALTTGNKFGFKVPFACTITGVEIGADASGSVVIDIWKRAAASYPPTVSQTITASAKPTLSSAQHASDTTLTGWTTSVAAGDWLFFNVDSVSTIKFLSINLTATKT